jgi:hypothetical protein
LHRDEEPEADPHVGDHVVHFEDPQHWEAVAALIEDGYTFREAAIRLKLRPLVDYTITRSESGPC